MPDLNTNKVKKDKKRRRRNYDDIDNQIQKIEEDTKTKHAGDNSKSNTRALDEVDSDDLNDDELDKLMLLEEEKEKLLNKTEIKDNDDSEESFELSAVEDIPTTRRTRGKVIDYKKTAEILDKDDAKQEYDSEDDAEYIPEE
ncbi:uncharacterized protein HGUI_02209 [Hanseniaspora guilliermondii]|uniref:Histone H2A.Z-specific chaperone CHZ1 n=1 Tax=Hanseniaspora guilliermondii TaxID=56406 RepID=A0A1L0CNH3_9ASCO|nr:uncharacterized protein HGUI_02209 [Hanseniaspora guilliermondii]